jgi:LysM repeat protein
MPLRQHGSDSSHAFDAAVPVDSNPGNAVYALHAVDAFSPSTQNPNRSGNSPLRRRLRVHADNANSAGNPTMPTMPMDLLHRRRRQDHHTNSTLPTTPGQIPTQQPTQQQPNTAQQPEGAPTQVPECSGFMHTVRAGDTLYMLARQYKITLDELMKANPNLDPYNLRIGMQLCIPTSGNEGAAGGSQQNSPAAEATADISDQTIAYSKVYQTQRGDTLTRILDRYEITFAALQSTIRVSILPTLLKKFPSAFLPRIVQNLPMSGAYIVKSGDSLDSISKKLLVTQTAF